jgi:hypothetical protein
MESVDPKSLLAAGWTRKNVASEPRLGEAVEMYRSLGFEVLLVPVLEECAAEGSEGRCTTCFGADENPDRYKVVYTRPKAGTSDDELFDP